jgi:Holliday junction resolvasome RuvABC endonuclease subunit
MTFLTLDLGTTTGWAVASPGIISGRQSFAYNSRFEGGGMRFLRFVDWLDKMYAARRFSRVAYEEVRFAATTDAAHVYGGFLGHLTAWCERAVVPYEAVPIGTIKKHATGKGNASKAQMIEAAVNRGHTPADDNEADALALMYWMIDTYGTPSTPSIRPAPDSQSSRRVPMGTVQVARRPVRS